MNKESPPLPSSAPLWRWSRHFLPAILTGTLLAQAIPEIDDTPAAPPAWDWSLGRGLPEAVRQRLDVLVAEGSAHAGVRYPVYQRPAEGGAPWRESELHAGRVERVTEDLVQIEKVSFLSYASPAEPDVVTRTVQLAQAWYDLALDFLFTDQPVDIVDGKQRIYSHGGMLHDRASGLTIFSGGVEIYFAEEESPASVGASPAPVPAAPAAPKP
jgi:hypothetical protein